MCLTRNSIALVFVVAGLAGCKPQVREELPPEPSSGSVSPPVAMPAPMATPPPAPAWSGPQMVVVRGSPNALAWYPIGRKVPVGGQVCLPANARYITFQRADGGTLTFGGGGCNKVIAEPPASGERAGAGSGP